MSNLRFRMLGPLEVERDGRTLALGGRQQRVVLASLLINANQPVSADRLVEQLWSDPQPTRALKRLQLVVTRLRKALVAGGPAGGAGKGGGGGPPEPPGGGGRRRGPPPPPPP